MSNKYQISKEYTFFFKVVLPGIFLSGVSLGFYLLFRNEAYNALGALVMVALGGGALVYYGFIRLKSVSIDKNHFYISNYLKTIQVPISDLIEVNDRSFPGSYKPITLHFIGDYPFGNSIVFLPEFESPTSPSKVPLAERLRRLI